VTTCWRNGKVSWEVTLPYDMSATVMILSGMQFCWFEYKVWIPLILAWWKYGCLEWPSWRNTLKAWQCWLISANAGVQANNYPTQEFWGSFILSASTDYGSCWKCLP
jgi:hypothetical protein